jgi:hypothetical protein
MVGGGLGLCADVLRRVRQMRRSCGGSLALHVVFVRRCRVCQDGNPMRLLFRLFYFVAGWTSGAESQPQFTMLAPGRYRTGKVKSVMPRLNSDWSRNLRYCYRVPKPTTLPFTRNFHISTSLFLPSGFLLFPVAWLDWTRYNFHVDNFFLAFTSDTHIPVHSLSQLPSRRWRNLNCTMLLRIALFFVVACLTLLVVGAEDYYKVRTVSLSYLTLCLHSSQLEGRVLTW